MSQNLKKTKASANPKLKQMKFTRDQKDRGGAAETYLKADGDETAAIRRLRGLLIIKQKKAFIKAH